MKRFIISVAAVLIAAIIVVSQVTEARLAVLTFVSDNRVAVGLCVAILIGTTSLIVGMLSCRGKTAES